MTTQQQEVVAEIADAERNLNRNMLTIQALDPSAHLSFSSYTGKWYISANIEISNGTTLTGMSEHADSPALAVHVLLKRLRAVDGNDFDQVLVTNASDSERRRHWRWNGAAFALDEHWKARAR